MSDETRSEADPGLGAVIASYLEAVDEGRAPDPANLVAQYPHLADELREFLAADLMMAAGSPVDADVADDTQSAGRDRTIVRKSGPETGTVVGSYNLFELVGEGGMGMVYRARDTILNRDVAIKVMNKKSLPSSRANLRFANEANITSQLQHPGIPPVHAVGTFPDGRPFFAMKLINGDKFDDLLKARANPSDGCGRFVASFEQICQAVAYSHSQGVIHRDLKPGNVMVGAFGEVQVMDWGLAKVLDTGKTPPQGEPESFDAGAEIRPLCGLLTEDGSILGTPAFMSPEQANGRVEQIDARSDVFGLGGILCAVLTGAPPFVGETAESTRRLAARGETGPAFARLDACGAEPGLIDLCRRCLNPDACDRPADAGEVAAAVAGLRADAEQRARQAELERARLEGERAQAELRVAEQRKRHRGQVIAAVLVLATLLAGVVGTTAALIRAEQARTEMWRAMTREMAGRLQSDMMRLAAIGNSLVATVKQGHAWNERQFTDWMNQNLATEPEILGLCIAFEPGAFDPIPDPVTIREPFRPLLPLCLDALDPFRDGYSLYVSRRDHRPGSPPVAEALTREYRYRAQGWYANTLRGDARGWEEPTPDLHGPMVAYTVPLHGPGDRPIGVLCVDLSVAYFDRLDAWLRHPNFGEGSYGFVLSPQGKVVSHPHLRRTVENPFPRIQDQWDGALAVSAGQMLAHAGDDVGELNAVDPATGRRSKFLFARFQPTNWLFVAVIPVDGD